MGTIEIVVDPDGPTLGDLPIDPLPFQEKLVWLREGTGLLGDGGWRVEFHGADRLGAMSRVWAALVRVGGAAGGGLDSVAPFVAFVSSVFDERSDEPSVLRIPERLTVVEPHGSRSFGYAGVEPVLAEVLAGEESAVLRPAPPRGEPAGRSLTTAGYAAAVTRALEALEGDDDLRKVVLCRDELVPADDGQCGAAIHRLGERFPTCWTFAVDGLLGATPELLASRFGAAIHSRVLAGSLPRHGGADEQERSRQTLREDPRYAEEHALAARSVVENLRTMGALDDEDPDAFVLELPNIFHLATDVRGVVADASTTVCDLVRAIHPTAAVAGVPRQEALDVIRLLEPRDRGRFSGPVGWMDASGDGELGLALRCGQQEDAGVRLFAGCGIVAGADPQAEVRETVAKLGPMLEALTAAPPAVVAAHG